VESRGIERDALIRGKQRADYSLRSCVPKNISLIRAVPRPSLVNTNKRIIDLRDQSAADQNTR